MQVYLIYAVWYYSTELTPILEYEDDDEDKDES